MVKHLLTTAVTAAAFGCAAAIAATPASLELTFVHTSGTAASDVTVNTNADGVTAELCDISPSVRPTSDSFAYDIVAANQNTNAAGGSYYVFHIAGLTEDFTFNTIGIDIHALNGANGYQQSPTDGLNRHVNFTITTSTDNTNWSEFAALSDLDPAKKTALQDSKLYRNWNFVSTETSDNVKVEKSHSGASDLYIKIAVAKGTDNQGCFIGFSKITLKTRNAQEYANNLESTKANYAYLGTEIQELLFDSANVPAAPTTDMEIAMDNVDDYSSYSSYLTADHIFSALDGKYVTFNRNQAGSNSNSTGYFGLISVNGAEGSTVYFKKTFDKYAIWQLIHVGDNEFKIFNPASEKYIGMLSVCSQTDNGYQFVNTNKTDGSQNKPVNLVNSKEDAATYSFDQTPFSATNNGITSQDALNGYVGIGCTQITSSTLASNGQIQKYLHRNGTSNSWAEQDIYMWNNQCGAGNAGSWQFTSWHITQITDNVVTALLNAKEFGEGFGKYTASAGDSSTGVDLTGANSQTGLAAMTVSDDYITALNSATLNMPAEGTFFSDGTDTYCFTDSKAYTYPAGAACTVAEGTEIGKYAINGQGNATLSSVETLTVSPDAEGYATFIAPAAVKFVSGTAFVGDPGVTGANSVMTLKQAEANSPYATGTGFLIIGEAQFEVTTDESAYDTFVASFEGYPCPTVIEEGKIGFAYKANAKSSAPAMRVVEADDTQAAIPGLTLSLYAAGETVPAFTPVVIKDANFTDEQGIYVILQADQEVSTSISEVSVDNANATAVIYDLTGRRLSAPVKGINIINGKKVRI